MASVAARMSAAFIKNKNLIPKKGRDFDLSFNIGNVTEGILATAIACRFLNKNSVVTSNDVIKLLKVFGNTTLKNNGKNKLLEVTKKSPNKNINIEDDVYISISLSEGDMEKLLQITATDSQFRSIINSSLRYVNSARVTAWSKLVYENNTYDKIKVYSKGTFSGKEDVAVEITDENNILRPVDISLSVKANNIKQFGQKGGIDFDNITSFFYDIFNFKFDSIKTRYTSKITEKKYRDALSIIYSVVRVKFNRILTTNNENEITKLFETMANGIKKYAVGSNPNTMMLDLGNDATLMEFSEIVEKIIAYRYKIVLFFSAEDKLPGLIVREISSKKVLFKLRSRKQVKKDGTIYYRNLIEKGPFLVELLKTEII